MSDAQRSILLALKAALDAALILAWGEPLRRALIGAQRAIARELWPT